MASNCQDSSSAKQNSLGAVDGMVRSAVSKGAVPPSLAQSVVARLSAVVAAQYAAGANPSQIRAIVSSNLQGAVAAASLAARQGADAGVGASSGGAGGRGTGPASAGPVIGPAGTADFFDPVAPAPGEAPADTRALPSRGAVSTAADLAGGPATEVTSGEVRSFLSGGAPPGDNDDFSIALWIGRGYNPLLMLDSLASAKSLHNGVVRECARYYKRIIYGNPDYPVRLGVILHGIIGPEAVRRSLQGGPTSRHLLGQAVNFSIAGVENARVVEDIRSGAIPVSVGTYGEVNGIHATLPFSVNGVRVENVRLWNDPGTPGYVGFDLPG